MISVAARVCFAALATTAFLVGGCGGGDEATKPEVQATTQVQETHPDVQQETKRQVATCIPAQRDEIDLGLRRTTLRSTPSGELEVTWTTKEPMPRGSESVLYSVSALDNGGDTYLQLGVKFLGGSQIAFFVFDSGDAYNNELGLPASVSATRVQAVFPADAISKLSAPFRWYSAFSIEARDDYCPDDAVGSTRFRTVGFPGP